MPLPFSRRFESRTPKPSGSTICFVGDSISDKQYLSASNNIQGLHGDTVATRFGYTRVGQGVSGGGSHTAAVAGTVTKTSTAVATVPITTAGTGYSNTYGINPYVIFAGGTPTTAAVAYGNSNGTGLTSVTVVSGGNYAGVPTASFSFTNDSTRAAVQGATLCDGSALSFTNVQLVNVRTTNMTSYLADVVVIYAGTNDLIQAIQNNTTYPANFTPAIFKAALTTMVQAALAQANNPLVVLCTLPPVYNVYGPVGGISFPNWAISKDDAVGQYNSAIRAVARENRCQVADFSTYNYAIGSTVANDLHAGPVGQAYYANQITAAILGAG